MTHAFYVTELHLAEPDKRRHHKIITDCGYREMVSFNAFFSGNRKIARDRKRGVLWIPRDETSHEIELEVDREFATVKKCVWDRLPIAEHNGMWEFYENIGYDYKTKKWVIGGGYVS